MKRFLALFLVLVLAFSCILVSCNKKNEPDDEEGEDSGEGFIGISTTTAAPVTLDPASPELPSSGTATDYEWTDDTNGSMVYVVVDGVSVRTDTNTAPDTYRNKANFGESYKRIKYNDVWTLIDYKGNQYYIATKYVTTDNGYVTFTEDAEETTVYVIASSLALRTNTYTDVDDDNKPYTGNIRTYVAYGVEMTKVATSANGKWIKVRVTYKPSENADPVTEVLCCKAEWVSTTPSGGNNTEVTAPPLG